MAAQNTPREPPRVSNDADRLKTLRTVWERSGDPVDAITAIGLTPGREAIVSLQSLLSKTRQGEDRDLIEDLVFALANGPVGNSSLAATVARKAAAIAGPHAQEFGDVSALADTLVTLSGRDIPEAALVAGVLQAFQDLVGDRILVDDDDLGEDARWYNPVCDECGGTELGKGYIICRHCLQNAEGHPEVLFASVQYLNKNPDSDLGIIRRELALARLKMYPDEYGCAACQFEPVKDCSCAKVFTIPPDVNDSIILRGKRPASGATIYAMVRLLSGR